LAKKQNIANVPREMTHRQLSRHQKQQRRQRFIFFGGIGIILAVILIIVGGWYFSEYAPMHQIVLQVYDTKYDASYFIDTLAIYGRSQGAQYLSSMASSIETQIEQNEILKVEAAKLGITISDDEATQYLTSAGVPYSQAGVDLARGYLLSEKVKTAHFTPMVPGSGIQLWVKAMMLESETVAKEVREKVINGENFTQLISQYAVDYASISNNGDYGWHPLDILKNKLYSTFPWEFISRADAKAGDVSQPLADNTSYKKVGYWLIRVNERPNEETANISAIFLGSEEEAIDIRARLLAGEELAPIAGNFSQYEMSKSKLGELGALNVSENITPVFNAYSFNTTTELGVWSQPLKEDTLYTRGGYWVVKIVDKAENKELTTEDRDQLISNLFSNWLKEGTDAASSSIVNNMNDELLSWLISKATVRMQEMQTG
jgi:parvulin-like peptidyl-prolyl isomerase